MTVKSIVDIDVRDEHFIRFARLFDRYREELHKTSEDWSRSDGETKKIRKTFAGMVRDLNDENEKTRKKVSLWKQLSSDSKAFATNIKDASISLLKWSSIGTIFAGLLGVGGFFGIEALARSVGATRRSALGLGTTYGERKAFEQDYGRIADPGALLSGVSDSLGDITRRYSLYGAGLTEQDLRGRDTAEVATRLLERLKPLVDRTPTSLLGQLAQARGLDQFGLGVEDLRRLKTLKPGELQEYARQYADDRKNLDVQEKIQKKWQDLSRTLSVAGQNIENVFVTGLAPLVPGIDALSSSLGKAIQTLMTAAEKDHWLEQIGAALEGAAKYIASPKFQSDVTSFVSDVGALAKSTRSALEWLGVVPDKKPMPTPKENYEKQQAVIDDLATKSGLRYLDPFGLRNIRLFGDNSEGNTYDMRNVKPLSSIQKRALAGNWQWESGMDPNKKGDLTPFGYTAYGIGQWHADRQAQFRKLFGYSMTDSSVSSGKKLQDEMKFGVWELFNTESKNAKAFLGAKSLAEAVTAYNRDVERPANYRASNDKRLGLAVRAKAEIVMKISNAAGASVNTSTAQLAPTTARVRNQ